MSKLTRGLALAAACLAGLAVAAPANSQTLDLGAVKLTRAHAQAPIAANAPIRVLSPGRNASSASSRAQAQGGGSTTSVAAPTAVNAPVRVLSPGRNGGGAQSRSGGDRGSEASIEAPVAVNAPVRILSPGDDGPGSTGTGGDGDDSESSPDGPVVNAPVAVHAPVRVLSPGDDETTGGGEAPAGAGADGSASGDNPATGGGELGQTAEGAECTEVQAMSAAGGSGTPLVGAGSLLLLALLGTTFVALRAAGRLPLTRWLP